MHCWTVPTASVSYPLVTTSDGVGYSQGEASDSYTSTVPPFSVSYTLVTASASIGYSQGEASDSYT